MAVGRRELMLGALGMGLALAASFRPARALGQVAQPFSTYGVVPRAGEQTAALQDAADQAAESGTPFFLPPGNYMSGKLELKSGTQILGVPGKSVLHYTGGGGLISIENASDIGLSGLTLEGEAEPIEGGGLLIAESVKGLTLSDCRVIGSAEHGIVLRKVSGRITDCEIGGITESGLFSEDSTGLEIAHNHVHDCSANGILVRRSEAGEDATMVMSNRIERITAKSGGSGENGNAINVLRAGSVLINGNRIPDCASSAIRASSASNCQMIGNSCTRLGDVALFTELSFKGVVIANNVVDKAAVGISVTNFKESGKLAVVQGNLIRNIFFRKDTDSRGIGIAIQADSVVSGNVIETSPGYGIMVGCRGELRDVRVTDNLIRDAYIGIGVSIDPSARTALITRNTISGAKDGAIRAVNGSTPVGSDLATAGATAYANLLLQRRVLTQITVPHG
jgi:uncharacterized secreted repeat protein (TIGR03808 family)